MIPFDLKVPIIQAPVGGVATPALAAAVSNSGGLGGLALSWAEAGQAKLIISKLHSLTDNPVYANFVLNFEPRALHQTLKSGIRIIQFSWGIPDQSTIDLVRSFDALIGIQVTDKQSALNAIAAGTDYLVCQGIEAGGHVQASKPLQAALKEVIDVAGHIPVFAAGGIASAADLYNCFNVGAKAIVMGTRFVASSESGAHQDYKIALTKSKSEDTALTVCMNKGWDSSLHRIIRNSSFNNWESAGCPVPGQRPGENDIIARTGTGNPIERYSFSAPTTQVTGEIEAMTQYAGTSVDKIDSVDSVAQIIDNIWRDYQQMI